MRKVIYLAAIALCLVACSIGGYNNPDNGGNATANYCNVTVYNKCQYDVMFRVNNNIVMVVDPTSNNSRDLVEAEKTIGEQFTDKLYKVEMVYTDYSNFDVKDMGSSSTSYTFKKGNNYTIVIATDMTFRITKD